MTGPNPPERPIRAAARGEWEQRERPAVAPAPVPVAPSTATATATLTPPSLPSTPTTSEPPAGAPPSPPATTVASARKKPPRDGFLDTVRSIALVRVIVWHAFGIPWISWVIATMPTMFFIAGSLLASTLDRKPVQVMYRARLKRLLVPYWFFAALVLSVLSMVHLMNPRPETEIRLDQLLPWIVPFTDPTASAWEGGWASSPLWYLRAYMWLLLISPLLRAATRRLGAQALLPAIVATAAIELWLHHPAVFDSVQPGTWTWMLGELTLYSFFLMLGFLHYDGAFEGLGRQGLLEWALIGVVACVLWWADFPAPTGIINHSFIGLMAVGVSWLAFFMLLRPVLSKATENNVTGPFVYLFNRRAMSVYLWHSPAIAIGYWMMDGLAPEAHITAVLIPSMLLMFIAIAATGWIEDVAGGNAPELWPRKGGSVVWRSPWVRAENGEPGQLWSRHVAGIAAGVALAMVLAGIVVPGTARTAQPVATASANTGDLPPAPSGRPGVADFGDGGSAAEAEDSNLPPAPSGRPGVADFGATETPVEDTGNLPPAPSGRPGVADFAEETTADAAPSALASVDDPDAALLAVIEAWLVEKDVAGARVAVNRPDGTVQSAATGEIRGNVVAIDDVVALTSATKSVTAAIVLDLVDQGLLELDAPIPPLDAVPGFAHNVTLRQVLDHTAGLAPYQESNGFASGDELTPAAAVALSANTELQWAPGTQRGYSNSGYLVLGLLAEQATGRSFAELANERVAAVGLETMRMDETTYQGWVGSSAGGMVGTVTDLAEWGGALYRDGSVISEAALAQMLNIDNEFNVGLGAFPVCPCGIADDGSKFYASIGHNGGEVTVQYSPGDDLVIAVSLTESLFSPFLTEQDVYELIAEVRTVAG